MVRQGGHLWDCIANDGNPGLYEKGGMIILGCEPGSFVCPTALLGQESFYFVGHYWGLGISTCFGSSFSLGEKMRAKVGNNLQLALESDGFSRVFRLHEENF